MWLPTGLVSPVNFSTFLSVAVLSAMTFTLGTDSGPIKPGVYSEVIRDAGCCSYSRRGVLSVRAIMGSSMSTNTKRHVKSRRSPTIMLFEVHS